MENWIEQVKTKLEAGQKPSHDELGQALVQALQLLDCERFVMQELGRALATIIIPRVKGDTDGVIAAVDAVIAKNITITASDSQSLH